MDKICEFCRAFRPVVYCKADSALLCLSCDAKVHSANALSNKHPRTLVCESCKYRPAYVRCFDHKMFMCRDCDQNLHHDSSQHKKQLIGSFVGCPSATDFAALWGFDLNELDNSVLQEFVSTSCVSVDQRVVNLDISRQSEVKSMNLVFGEESQVGSSNQRSKVVYKGKQQDNTCFILLQILDLRRLQLTERNKNSSFIWCQKQTDPCSSKYDTAWNLDRNPDQHLQQSLDIGTDHQQIGSTCEELKVEPFLLPFSQSEHLSSSTTVGNPLQGDVFWQCKSPVQSNQLWSQNMQDLGVCEDLGFYDDFNIPDVDLTFRNFEELFGGDHDPTVSLLDTCFSVDKDVSLDRSDDGYATAMEDASFASSVYITQSGHADNEVDSFDHTSHYSKSGDRPLPVRPCYSTLSFSLSRLSAESSGTDYMDCGLSPIVAGMEHPRNSPDPRSAQMEDDQNATMIYKEKKKVQRSEKQIRQTAPKTRTDAQKRVKGRSVRRL